MINPEMLDLLLPEETTTPDSGVAWATVEQADPLPLRIRMSGETEMIEADVVCLIDPLSIYVGMRVAVLKSGKQRYIIGPQIAPNPVGSVLETVQASAPDGRWLPMTGLTYENEAYPRLAAMLGPGFAVDADHFMTPNKSGRTAVGVNPADADLNAAGKLFGTKTHTLLKSELPNWDSGTAGSHNHGPNTLDRFMVLRASSGASRRFINRTSGDQYGWVSATQADLNSATATDTAPGHTHVVNSTGGDAHNNMQPSIAMYFYISY